MFGWSRTEIARASLVNRVRNWTSAARLGASTLMATVRSNRVSRARYTSPMPPAPTGDSIA
jgi:hypothetical protein